MVARAIPLESCVSFMTVSVKKDVPFGSDEAISIPVRLFPTVLENKTTC
jgi:hypothetical protein